MRTCVHIGLSMRTCVHIGLCMCTYGLVHVYVYGVVHVYVWACACVNACACLTPVRIIFICMYWLACLQSLHIFSASWY